MAVLQQSGFEGLHTGRRDSRRDGKIDATANEHVQHASYVRENRFYKNHTEFLSSFLGYCGWHLIATGVGTWCFRGGWEGLTQEVPDQMLRGLHAAP